MWRVLSLSLAMAALGQGSTAPTAVLRVSERAVVSDARQSLDGSTWTVTDGVKTVPATVPGDLCVVCVSGAAWRSW